MKTGKVVLVSLPQCDKNIIELGDNIFMTNENLALGYLSASLDRYGINNKIIDSLSKNFDIDTLIEEVLDITSEQDIIGISILSSTVQNAKEFIHGIKRRGHNGYIIVGGWIATIAPEELMYYIPEIDFLLQGESEYSLVDLIKSISNNISDININGLYRRNDGTILPPKSLNSECFDINSLPFPNHYSLDENRYSNIEKKSIAIQSSRGCSWGKCTFCVTAYRYKGLWRYRSAISIISEIKYLIERYNINRFTFVDDSFFGMGDVGKQRAIDFANLLLKENLSIEFGFDCKITDFDRKLFEKLRIAGLSNVFIGIENGNNNILRELGKGYSTNKILETIKGLKELNIKIIPGYIAFTPYMNFNELKDSLLFQVEILSEYILPNPIKKLIPEINTRIYKKLVKDGLLIGNFPNYDFKFKDNNVARLYEQLKRQLNFSEKVQNYPMNSDKNNKAEWLQICKNNIQSIFLSKNYKKSIMTNDY